MPRAVPGATPRERQGRGRHRVRGPSAWRRCLAAIPAVDAWDRPLECSLMRLRPEAGAAGAAWSRRMVKPSRPNGTRAHRLPSRRCRPPSATAG